MNAFNRILVLIILLKGAVFFSCCQQSNGDKLNEDQKEVFSKYVSEHLLNEDQYLYFKSEESLDPLSSPLTPEDFKLPKIALPPGVEMQPPDTLFSKKELNDWSKEISSYKQFKWDQSSFSSRVEFIRDIEIPAYRKRTAIPPPGKTSFSIHYISIPFIYDGRSALLYSRTTKGAGSVRVKYYYFKKADGNWDLVEQGPLTTIY